MSHTMGPWKFEVVDETDSFLGCKRLDGGDGGTVIDLSDEWTGYPECGQDLQMTISKDDAALIAAAPEMLEALESVLSLIDESSGVVGYHLNGNVATWGELALREELEAAIRKARGEE